MNASKLPYLFLLVSLIALNGVVLITPFLAAAGDSGAASSLHTALSPTCHQLASRSLCLFVSKADGSYSIGDCVAEGTVSYTRQQQEDYAGRTGYKFPVCSRDVAIYFAMLLGTLALPFFRRIESEDWPSSWLLLAACVPIGVDGLTQLLGLRESTNSLRLLTGFIVGIVLPFYIVPILNSVYGMACEGIAGMGKGEARDKGKRGKGKGIRREKA
jgi:uncharacterized membrane protein